MKRARVSNDAIRSLSDNCHSDSHTELSVFMWGKTRRLSYKPLPSDLVEGVGGALGLATRIVELLLELVEASLHVAQALDGLRRGERHGRGCQYDRATGRDIGR